jgi:hypothetical protein
MRLTAALLLSALAVSGCSRVMGLPAVPESVTRKDAGLDGLDAASQEAKRLRVKLPDKAIPADAIDRARAAMTLIDDGNAAAGLAAFAAAVEAAPADLYWGTPSCRSIG